MNIFSYSEFTEKAVFSSPVNSKLILCPVEFLYSQLSHSIVLLSSFSLLGLYPLFLESLSTCPESGLPVKARMHEVVGNVTVTWLLGLNYFVQVVDCIKVRALLFFSLASPSEHKKHLLNCTAMTK